MSTLHQEPTRTPTVIVKPILYGNTAKHFGSKRDSDGHTHKWSVYVRAYHNENLSAYISRVQFRLHETYPNNVRVIHRAPFEVEESGWGEFETQITIFFVDPNEKPITFYHHLRLFCTDPDVVTGKKPLVNEYYDELVFQEPSDFLRRLLTHARPLEPCNDNYQAIAEEYTRKKAETKARLTNARHRVSQEIQDLIERLRVTQENIQRLRQRSVDHSFSSGAFSPVINET